MSTDKPETQKKFKDKNKLPYDLISDPGGEIAKALGISVRGGSAAAEVIVVHAWEIVVNERVGVHDFD